MLPFHHVRGFTLFPEAQQVGNRWTGVTHIVAGCDRVQCLHTAGQYDTEYATRIASAIEAAAIASAILEMD